MSWIRTDFRYRLAPTIRRGIIDCTRIDFLSRPCGVRGRAPHDLHKSPAGDQHPAISVQLLNQDREHALARSTSTPFRKVPRFAIATGCPYRGVMLTFSPGAQFLYSSV